MRCGDCEEGTYAEKHGNKKFTFKDGVTVEYYSWWYECPDCGSTCLSREMLDSNMQHMYYARFEQLENRLAALESRMWRQEANHAVYGRA